jgi:hypothetical protein
LANFHQKGVETPKGIVYDFLVVTKTTPLFSKSQTGRAMYRLVEAFHGDIGALAGRSLPEYFSFVKRIPYLRDRKGTETVARPRLLLTEFPALDCKKKAILIAAWCKAHGIPYRFVACSERPDRMIHHVFPQAAIGRRWRNLDATYPKYRMFEKKPRLTRAEVLKP